MHVREQVKEFVHDVKRKFSHKHKRDTTSTFDSHEYSSTDSHSHIDDSSSSSSSSSAYSRSGTPGRSRLVKFIRPRVPSTSSKKNDYNVLRRLRSVNGKRYRLFSAPAVPSEPMVEHNHKQPASYQGPPSSGRSKSNEGGVFDAGEYSDVIDISARGLVTPKSARWEEDSSQSLSCRAFRDSASQTPPQFDTESRSDTSGTLVTATSQADLKHSTSSSDSHLDNVDSNSDEISEKVHDSAPFVVSMADPPRDDPPPPPPSFPGPVYIPRLTAPSMFLPVPNTDPLSALLTKYVHAEQRPRRDVVGEYAGRDLHEMVMSNSWRALAKMAHDRIVASDPEDLARILDLWFLRLSSLARLRLTNQASAECANLFAVLDAVHTTSVPGTFPGSGPPSAPLSPSGLGGLAQLPGTPSQKPSGTLPPATPAIPPRQGVQELSHPFELTVFHARVHYWSGDPLGYIDALSAILTMCKGRAREEGRIVIQQRELWQAAMAQGETASQSEQASGHEDNDEDERRDENESENKNGGDEDRVEKNENEHGGDEDGVEENENKNGGDEDGVEENENEDEDKNENENESENEVEVEVDEGCEQTTESTEEREEREEPNNVLVVAEANLSMWLERIARVCLMLASQMIEMNEYQAAINLLSPLCTHRAAPTFLPMPSPALHSALARVYLLSGNLHKAQEHFSIAASAAANDTNGPDIVAMNTALLAAASGDWTRAEDSFSELIARDPENFTAINNLAVTLLCLGRIKEGIDRLEAALKASPSSMVVAEPFLFNLSTLYELRSTAAIDKKRELLLEVAKWSGDGLRTSCLKMPSS